MRRLVIGAIALAFILGGLGTWLLWNSYHSEDHTIPNSHAFEKAVRAKHPDATFCSLVQIPSLDYDVGWQKSQAKKGRGAIDFAVSPEEFANYFNGEGCIIAVKPYISGGYTGQKLYLGETGSGKFVAWHETYVLPGWTLKAVSDETITYNRNNGEWLIGGTVALWVFLYVGTAYFLVFHGTWLLDRNKPAAP